mmetsp:Transcript_23434/g.69615  ORF Transcript_23434/g.69615 Transcript_23434/m.69615 type:complete len:228 (+) Transcript_23434:291-974(+)
MATEDMQNLKPNRPSASNTTREAGTKENGSQQKTFAAAVDCTAAMQLQKQQPLTGIQRGQAEGSCSRGWPLHKRSLARREGGRSRRWPLPSQASSLATGMGGRAATLPKRPLARGGAHPLQERESSLLPNNHLQVARPGHYKWHPFPIGRGALQGGDNQPLKAKPQCGRDGIAMRDGIARSKGGAMSFRGRPIWREGVEGGGKHPARGGGMQRERAWTVLGAWKLTP